MLGLGLGAPDVPVWGNRSRWVLPNAAVDLDFAGRRYFGSSALSSLISCSRASTGYATNSDGTLTSFAANTPRIGAGTGLLVEEARTSVVLWNRDLTNAAWTKSNVTAAKDQVGVDGTANGASSITATAGNGTCLQAITLASAAAFQSAYVKRLVGSGVIQMTMDNGATWTAITVTSSYTQLTIPTQTLANPTVGFRIVTSGDRIAVDLVQNEGGAFGTSAIPTTTVAVTRAQDVVTLAGAALTAIQSNHSVVAQFARPWIPYGPIFEATDGTNNNRIDLGALNQFTYFTLIAAGVQKFDGLGPTFAAPFTPTKDGYSVNSTLFSAAAAGTLSQASIAAALPTITTGYLGNDTNARSANAYIQRLSIWSSRLSDAALTAFTA